MVFYLKRVFAKHLDAIYCSYKYLPMGKLVIFQQDLFQPFQHTFHRHGLLLPLSKIPPSEMSWSHHRSILSQELTTETLGNPKPGM